jgi:hypothetical protein
VFTNLWNTPYNQSAQVTIYFDGCYFYGGPHPNANDHLTFYPEGDSWTHVRFYCLARELVDEQIVSLNILTNTSIPGIDDQAIPEFSFVLDNFDLKAEPIQTQVLHFPFLPLQYP